MKLVAVADHSPGQFTHRSVGVDERGSNRQARLNPSQSDGCCCQFDLSLPHSIDQLCGGVQHRLDVPGFQAPFVRQVRGRGATGVLGQHRIDGGNVGILDG